MHECVCVYTGTRPWKNVSLLWLCLFFIKVTNLRLTLKCSNDPFLFGDSTSQLKGIPAETSRRRAETHAWIFNRLFCRNQERPRQNESSVSVWHWNAAAREGSSAAWTERAAIADKINELRQKVNGRASGLAAAADWCGAPAEMVGHHWLVVSVSGNNK